MWNLSTNKIALETYAATETDNGWNIEGNDLKEKQKKKNLVPLPTILHNIDGPNIPANEVVSIAPGEEQLPVLFTSEPDWKALAFV